MTKDQFMNELDRRLKALPQAERMDILQDYREHFGFGAEAGKTDQEIAVKLGHPAHIARELLADYRLNQATATTSTTNTFRAILAVGGLSFLNLVFVLGPAIGVYGMILGLWGTALGGIATPFALLLFAAMGLQTFLWFEFFLALTFCGIGILMGLAAWKMTILAKKLTLRYLKFNLKVIKGE
ncbi:MAG: DUF1700 domain-containing protein [Turicibacter sp.]|nr:DUF1700 domain-containing protein [Turicibacter sp.]